MVDGSSFVAGIEIPSTSPMFLAVVGFHVLAGLAGVITGAVAVLSAKGRGRHSKFGTIYFCCLTAVFISATALSAMRWVEDYHLFILGTLSFTAAFLGRRALQRRWLGWASLHVTGMGLSYVLLLTAFYVDNGKSLPLWKELPPIAYWRAPGAVGIPLIVYALLRHPVVRRSKTIRA